MTDATDRALLTIADDILTEAEAGARLDGARCCRLLGLGGDHVRVGSLRSIEVVSDPDGFHYSWNVWRPRRTLDGRGGRDGVQEKVRQEHPREETLRHIVAVLRPRRAKAQPPIPRMQLVDQLTDDEIWALLR